MTKDEKLILGKMLQLLQIQSACIAALENALTSGALGGSPLSPTRLEDMKQEAAKQQQETYRSIGEGIFDLPNT
jgi:hypothetical protein